VRRVEAAARVKEALPAFDQLAASMVARSGVPGAAVAVVAGDTVAYVRCFGLRQMGSPDKVTEDTLFQLGAVSRSYTTTTLAALAGEGELRWDQPVRRVWPGFRLRDRWATREATFRDLTAQRSGLPAYAGAELLQFGYRRAEILRRLRYLRPAAGFRAAYAPQDAVFTAAASAAERATGVSWRGLVRTRVLEPIGDEQTALGYRACLAATNRAAPHRLVAGSMVAQDPSDETVFAPSLGVSSSVTALESFARLQLNGGALGGVRVAPAGLLAQTLTPATAVAAGPYGPEAAGLGWLLWSFDDRLVASAEGGLASGSAASVSLVPDDGVAVIVLANAYPEGAPLGRALTKTLVDLAARGTVQEDWLAHEEALLEGAPAGAEAGGVPGEPAAAGGEHAPGLVLPPEAPAGAAAPRARGVYAGVYVDRYYGRVTVLPGRGDGLSVRLGRGATLRYVPWNRDIWRDTASGTAAVFAVRDGRARSLTLTLLSVDGRRGTFARAD
jgi:CubicO group peptidase (beta-lactamase class C family)